LTKQSLTHHCHQIKHALTGNSTLRALGTPLLYQSLYAATRRVANPNSSEVAAGRKSVYDTWFHTYPWEGHDSPVCVGLTICLPHPNDKST